MKTHAGITKSKRPKDPKQSSYVAAGHDIGFEAKIAIRRYFLTTYHAEGPIKVMDCCQGEGHIWRELRGEFKLDQYWGIDSDKYKRRNGRLVIDSRRILALGELEQNVYDIDTYGSPWKHWLALLQHGPQAMTVFLTFGSVKMGVDSAMVDVLGIRMKRLQVPDGLLAKITTQHGAQFCLGQASLQGYRVVECREAVPHREFKVEVGHGRKARYFGIRLEKRSKRDSRTDQIPAHR